MIKRFHTGERSSKIVKYNGVVYLTGQIGGTEGDITVQTKECLSRVEALLEEAGSSKEQMLQVEIWLADMSDFAAMNEVWNAWVPDGHSPARACGRVELARPQLKIEVIVTAACSN